MTLKTFDWNNATPDERDAAVASFMPPSNVNPMRRYYVMWRHAFAPNPEPKDYSVCQLNVADFEEGQRWLDNAKALRATWEAYFDKITEPMWSQRGEVFVKEFIHHMRRSQVECGGADLLAHLAKEGGQTINFYFHQGTWRVFTWGKKSNGETLMETNETFAHACCRLFLRANGVEVIDSPAT